jgi:hypothetical protein
VSEKTGLPVVFFSATSDVVEQMDLRKIGLPVLKLNRSLLKPWERRPEGD